MFLSLFTVFILKSILSDMSIVTPAFFWSLFAWKIFFPALHFQSVCVTCFEVGLLEGLGKISKYVLLFNTQGLTWLMPE